MAAGSATVASKTATCTRGTTQTLVLRWTGNDGALDLSNYTASIFVDGTKGTDASGAAAPTEAGTSNLYLVWQCMVSHQPGDLREVIDYLRSRPKRRETK